MNVLNCKVCGMSFQPLSAYHYIVREREERVSLFIDNSWKELKLFDAYECPLCGAQNIAGERLPLWVPDISEKEEAK